MRVEGVGGINHTAHVLDNEELILDGPPLIPSGKAARVGGWTHWWTPNHGPCILQLSDHEQKQLDSIVSDKKHIRPLVIDDIPYLSKTDAFEIRKSMWPKLKVRQTRVLPVLI